MEKVDLSRWAHLPRRDIEGTLQTTRAPVATPQMRIRAVSGKAITMNVMPSAGVNLAKLRRPAKAAKP